MVIKLCWYAGWGLYGNEESMQTVVDLGNGNCTWCRDAMTAELWAQPAVHGVSAPSGTRCLVVDHDHDSTASLIAAIGDDLRGWELADNGERVMVTLDARAGGVSCPHGVAAVLAC